MTRNRETPVEQDRPWICEQCGRGTTADEQLHLEVGKASKLRHVPAPVSLKCERADCPGMQMDLLEDND